MGQQGVFAVEHMGHGVALVGPQADFRVHAHKIDVGAVIFPWPDVVELVIVFPAQGLPAFRVLENPVLERLADGLLLLLGDGGLLFIEDADFLPVLPMLIKNAHIPLVQQRLKNLIGVNPLGAVGGVDADVILAVGALVQHPPLAGGIGIHQLDLTVPQPFRGLAQLIHELLVVFGVDPGRAHADADLRGGEVLGLHLLQLLHIDGELRVILRCEAGLGQLHPHIAGQVFVRRLPAMGPALAALRKIEGAGGGVLEDDALQIGHDLRNFVRPAHETGHVLQIHAGLLADGHRQGLHRRVHAGDGAAVLDGALGEHIRLALQLALIVDDLQRAQQRVSGILFKGQLIAQAVQQPVFLGVLVVKTVEISLFRLHFIVPGVLQLEVDEFPGAVPDGDHALDALHGRFAQCHRRHAGIFAEIEFSLPQRIAEIADGRVGGNGFQHLAGLFIRRVQLQQLPVGRGEVPDGPVKLVGEVRPLDGGHGVALSAILGAVRGGGAQHHVRVL